MIGVLASSETAASSDANDGLTRLNAMIKSWGIEGLMIYKITREQFTMTSGLQAQTMGSGGTYSTTRPLKITGVSVLSGSMELPVEILTAEQWQKIPDKTTTSNYPYRVYIEGTYPLETLNLWPIPIGGTIVIYSEKPISTTLALTDTLSFPDGYEECFEYNLAKRLAPEYGRQLDPVVAQLADDLKANIMRQNTKPAFMETDAPKSADASRSQGRFNLLRGF